MTDTKYANASSGEFGFLLLNSSAATPEYTIFSNPDSYSKEVTYSAAYELTLDNYFVLFSGRCHTRIGWRHAFFDNVQEQIERVQSSP